MIIGVYNKHFLMCPRCRHNYPVVQTIWNTDLFFEEGYTNIIYICPHCTLNNKKLVDKLLSEN